jgi:hypothetical protein
LASNKGEEPTFEVKDNYEDLLMIINTNKDAEKRKVSTLTQFNNWLRSYLWTKYINKLLFYSLIPAHQSTDDPSTGESTAKISLYNLPLVKLIGYCFLSQSKSICYFSLFLNFILNADLISLMLPLSVLFYALLNQPMPHVNYWKGLMVYNLVVIFIKFFYQLPIFCGTPAYTWFSYDTCNL